MPTRRDFVKQSSLLFGSLALPHILTSCGNPAGKRYPYKPGLQLYTIRDAMEIDPEGSLEKVAKLGYQLVESATYTGTEKFYGMSPADFATVIKQNGLMLPSGHYALGDSDTKGTILNGWEKAVEDAHVAGLKYMVCAWLPEEQRKTLDDYKKRAAEFNKAGEVCKKAGIQFCYHNHDFEFEKIDNQIPYDILLNDTEKELVKMEMDIYWVTYSGLDPVKMIDKNPGRYELWHVKDVARTADKSFMEVGKGRVDWPRIFAHAKKSGLKHFFVEQDQTPGDPFVSIEKSIQYLKTNILD